MNQNIKERDQGVEIRREKKRKKVDNKRPSHLGDKNQKKRSKNPRKLMFLAGGVRRKLSV